MVALVASVAVVTIILQILTSRARFVGSRLPTPLFLAWRRATGNDVGTQLVTGALAVGLGLVALSIVLVGSLERNTEVKLVAEIGAETRAELLVRPPADLELPPDTTLLSYDPTRLTPGDRPVRVLAIDPASFTDAVEWPAEFGEEPAEVLALLDKDVGDDLPVVVVAGGGIPATGAFGVQRFPYTVVGEVRSAPLVTEFGATLLVSAERLDRFALERIADQMGTTPDDPDLQERYRAPTLGHRQNLVSRLPADALVEFLEANEMNWREITIRASRANSVDFLAPQFAFDYLRMLGFVAALAAGAALLLHLASRRTERALAATMTGRMGLSASGSALVTVIEVVTLSLIALLTALAVAPVVTNRLLPRFDPAPLLPPAAAIQAPVIPLALGFSAVIAVAALAVWLLEALTARRDRGRLLRGLD
jgi:hypothetical protein